MDVVVLWIVMLALLALILVLYKAKRWPFREERFFEPWAYDDLGEVPPICAVEDLA